MMLAASRGDLLDLLRLLCMDNPIPSLCANICPAWCQSHCVRSNLDDGLQIQKTVRFALSQVVQGDSAWPLWASHFGASPARVPEGIKAAVIGAGPSGLAAAWRLASFRVEVTVYEAGSQAGGRLRNLSETDLPAHLLQRDISAIQAAGVTFVYNHSVEDVQRLPNENSAIILATGLSCRLGEIEEFADNLNISDICALSAGQCRIGACHPIHSVADGIHAADEALIHLFPGSGFTEHRSCIDISRTDAPANSFHNPSALISLQPPGRLPLLEEIQAEGARCLDCSVLPRLNRSEIGECTKGVSVCPTNALKLVQDEAGVSLILQPDICIRCGVCAQACQKSSIVLTAVESRREFRLVHGI